MRNMYYDESFSDRKITNRDGILNILRENTLDSYVSIFIIIETNLLSEVEKSYYSFEEKTRAILGLSNESEVKGESISKKKQFKNGIAWFHKNTIEIYKLYFDFLLDYNFDLQMNVFNKMELLLISSVVRTTIPKDVNERNFVYSLSKFLSIYNDSTVLNSFFEPNYYSEPSQKIIYLMKEVEQHTKGIERKIKESIMIKDMIQILNKVKFKKINDIPWNYRIQLDGALNLLKEIKISPNTVNFHPDEGSGLIPYIDGGLFQNFNEMESQYSVGVRICDIFSNFMGRLIKSFREDVLEVPLADIYNHDFSVQRLINIEWFKINENQYNLYASISKLINSKKNTYWSSFTGSNSDDLIIFVSLVHYFGDFNESFEEYCEYSFEAHVKRFNSYHMEILKNSYE